MQIRNIIIIYIILILIPLIYCSTIIELKSQNYRSGHFAFNSDGDMIIEYSVDNNGKYRLFYGLKKNGKFYFKDDSQNSIPAKEIQLNIEAHRYEAQNIFVLINGKEYLFSIAIQGSVAELYDLNNGNNIEYKIKSSSEFIGNTMFSFVFSLLDMKTSSKRYLISYISDDDKKYQLKKFDFNNFGFENGNYNIQSTSETYSIDFSNRIVNCFLMGDIIVVFLVKYGSNGYDLYIYDSDLNPLNKDNLPTLDSVSNFNSGYGIFSKAYHLKDKDAIFIYFKEPNYNLNLQVVTISDDYKGITQKIYYAFSGYEFEYDVLLSNFIKIDSERFAYIGVPKSSSKTNINIILIDLYNNYNSMNIRIYKETLNNAHTISREISGDVYNGYLIFTCTAKTNDNEYSILMIFGYANCTDSTFDDISEYFMDDDYDNSKNLIDKLLQNVQIENNIFSYSLIATEIKLVTIPNELLFYNKNTGTEVLVSNGENLNRIYTFKQNQNSEKTDEYYYLDYQPILQEPTYDKYNDNTIGHDEVNKKEEYQNNYSPKLYYGRTITVKFKLCHEYCEKCKKYGKSDNEQLCLSCLPDYKYFYNNQFNNNCIPINHFYDLDRNILLICDDNNSKFYVNLTDSKKICFKKSLPCPDEYPYYNETNNECINYTIPIPTTIITTIPTTITTTIPTTITTTIPTTITTTIPTTILTTIPIIPTTIQKTIPKTDRAIIHTTIPTTFPTTSLTTIPTTILTTIPTTILTTIPTTTMTTVPSTEKISVFICNYQELLNGKCSFKNKTNTEIYNIIKTEIMPSYPPDGKSIVINGTDNYVFQITNNKNELSALNLSVANEYNLSMVDLNKCGEALKDINDINDEMPLNILKFEKLSNLTIEKNIQYEIFEVNSTEKLNLSICKDKPVDIYIPIELSSDTKIKYEDLKSQGYDLFDKESKFYTDICTPYNSPNGTDVSLSVRNSEFYNSTETSCQKNCKYSDYSSESSFLKCECSIVEDNIDTQQPEKFTGLTFLLSFYEVLKNSNYEVLQCYGLTLKLINFIVNIGSIVVMALFLLYLIFVIMYIFTGINQLKIEISKIMAQKSEKNLDNNNNKHNNNNNNKNELDNNTEKNNLKENKERHKKKGKTQIKNNKIKKDNPKENNRKSLMIFNNKSINKKLIKKSLKQEIKKNKNLSLNQNNNSSFPPKKIINKQEIKKSNFKNDITISKNSKDSNLNLNSKTLNTNKLIFEKLRNGLKSKSVMQTNKNNNILIVPNNSKELEENKIREYKYSNMELNELEYLEAIEHDKRSFGQIYWNILNREHLILFTFFSLGDYNLTSVKLARFFFCICTDLAMNVFFFSDDSMHKIYKSYGKWDIVTNIPQIIYSLLVSQAIQIFICFLTLTDKHIYQIKHYKFENNNNAIPIFKILKCIKIKLCLFYVITFFLFIFYWYIVTSFCAVYKNTQIIFMKDSLSSFLGGILYPFPLYIFPALLRIISLKAEKKNLSCLYKISDFIPIF